MRRLLLATLLVAVAAPAAAQAGTSFQIGVGRSPEIVVDTSGLARVAWSNSDPGIDTVTYCTVPRGATACASKVDLRPPSDNTVDVAILRDGLNITLLAGAGDGVYANTFPAANTPANSWTKVANDNVFFSASSAILGPTPGPGSIMIAAPARTQAFLKTGPPPATIVEHDTTFSIPTSGGIALEPGTNRPVRFSADGDNINSHRYTSNNFSVAALNTSTNWSAPVVEELAGSEPELAAGPRGLFMFNNATIGSGRSQFKIRRFNGTRFGPPTDAAPEETGYEYDLFQQPTTGTLTAVWRQNFPEGASVARVRLIRSTDGGVTWSTPGDVVRESESNFIQNLRLGVAPDDQGFAVYEGEGTGGDGATKAPIRLTTLGVLPPEVGPSPPPVVNPPVANPPIVTPPVVTPPVVAPPRPVSTVKTTTATAGGARLSLGTPRACVRAGGTFTVTLKFAKIKRKGNLFVKVTRVDFSGTGIKTRIDRRAPFRQTLRVKVGTTKGAKVSVRARAFIKVRRGRGPKKSIRASVTVCR